MVLYFFKACVTSAFFVVVAITTVYSQSNAIFNGGNADGFAQTQYTQPDNNNIFAGGSYDGFSQTSFEQNASNSIFNGGNADGFDQNSYQQSTNNAIFAGGNADGFDQNSFQEATNNTIFAGGNADGFDQNNYEESINNNIFAGGDADGYDDKSYEQDASNSIFTGGNADGYDETNYEQDASNSIFAGGNADGYDAQNNGGTTGLPVELIYFKAAKQAEKVKLKWATASEKNAREFKVQKRMPSGNFETIVTKPAAGNSLSTIRYQAFDKEPREGYNYYRLKEVDYDGSTQLSNIKSVYYGANPQYQIGVYPNPADEEVNVSLKGFSGPVNIGLYSMQGKRILGKQYQSVDDEDPENLELPSDVKSGVYLLKVIPQQTGQTKTIKLVVE